MKNKLFLGASSLALAGLLFTAAPVQGFWPFGKNDGQLPPLIQKIIQKFNLDESEVRQLVNEHQQEQQQQRQNQYEEKLNQAVSDGQITEDQKKLILAKHQEMQENMQSWKDLTPDERHTKSLEKKQEIKTWAEENGIDASWLWGWGRGFKQGFKAGKMLGR